MKIKKVLATLLSAAVMATAAISTITTSSAADTGVMRDMTTMELVRDMGVGINLGNTMESCGDWINGQSVSDYEKAWGSPIITKDMIKGYASQGFGVVRVPVAWSNLMGDNYQISDAYFERVKEIVDWIIEEDMYAIINIHYDSGWLKSLPTDPEGCKDRFETMWVQIADYFKNYSDYLMFESQNEELGWSDIWNQWTGTAEQKAQSYAYVNEINQIFVDTVRASGGNNDKRHLLISGYTTDIALTCDPLFVMPTDPANRSAVSVHYYTPASFAILEEDADWAECRETWGTEADLTELETNMELMKTTFIDKGIPVIIGEYGCPKKNKDADSVQLFLSSVCREAYERQMCPVLWDTTGLHYDRNICALYDQELREIFNEISGFEYDPDATVPTEPPTEVYKEENASFSVDSNGNYHFNTNGADAVRLVFKGSTAGDASGAIGYMNGSNWDGTTLWSGSFSSDGSLTCVVDLPEAMTAGQVQIYYKTSNVTSIALDSITLLYYRLAETTEPTETTEETSETTTATDPVETTTTTTTTSATTATDPVETTTTITTTSATTATDPVETTTTTTTTLLTATSIDYIETTTTTTTTKATTAKSTTITTLITVTGTKPAEPYGEIVVESMGKTEYSIGEEVDLSGLLVSLKYYPGGSSSEDCEYILESVNPLDHPDAFIVDASYVNTEVAGTYFVTIECTDEYKSTYAVTQNHAIEVYVTDSSGPSIEFGEVSELGDVNVDGFVNVNDIITLAKFTLNREVYPLKDSTAYANADIVVDKVINSSDISRFVEFLLGSITKL